MYVPDHFAAPGDAAVAELLAQHGAADLITATDDGLLATLLPFIYDPDRGERGALLGHVARNNDQWRRPAIGQALVIVRGPDAYVSPTWYASKAEHGRVVPTWNYITAHVYGDLIVHDDVDWLSALVRRLTEKHESGMTPQWSVDDAPEPYIAGQLRGDRGLGARDHARRGQVEAQPESLSCGRRRRRHGATGWDAGRASCRRADAPAASPLINSRIPAASSRSAGAMVSPERT